ncbi:hypothetical protein HN51_018561, partial [Arachis hypogaea]
LVLLGFALGPVPLGLAAGLVPLPSGTAAVFLPAPLLFPLDYVLGPSLIVTFLVG